MKKVLLIGMLLCIGTMQVASGQTFSEWFRQKKTQKKYLMQQIALLQTYLGYVKKGYTIVNDGITTVRKIKNGEFGLHDIFYADLYRVNPKIREYSKVATILADHQSTLRLARDALQEFRVSPLSRNPEVEWLTGIYDGLSQDAHQTLDELIQVLTSGKLGLSDDERIGHIDRLYEQAREQLAFAQMFASDIQGLLGARQQEHEETQYLFELYKNDL